MARYEITNGKQTLKAWTYPTARLQAWALNTEWGELEEWTRRHVPDPKPMGVHPAVILRTAAVPRWRKWLANVIVRDW